MSDSADHMPCPREIMHYIPYSLNMTYRLYMKEWSVWAEILVLCTSAQSNKPEEILFQFISKQLAFFG